MVFLGRVPDLEASAADIRVLDNFVAHRTNLQFHVSLSRLPVLIGSFLSIERKEYC